MDKTGYVGEIVVLSVVPDAGASKQLMKNFGRNFLGTGAVCIVRENRLRGTVCGGCFRGGSQLCRASLLDSFFKEGLFGLDQQVAHSGKGLIEEEFAFVCDMLLYILLVQGNVVTRYHSAISS